MAGECLVSIYNEFNEAYTMNSMTEVLSLIGLEGQSLSMLRQ